MYEKKKKTCRSYVGRADKDRNMFRVWRVK
jgi:hypothetical protein